MSDTAADFLLDTRGTGQELGAWVVGAAFVRNGQSVAFALGDGTLRLARPAEPTAAWTSVEAHPGGACLALVADCGPAGFLTGGDDGRLVATAADGTTTEVAKLGAMKWVEHVAAHEGGLRAASV